jgi:hypothetical protein
MQTPRDNIVATLRRAGLVEEAERAERLLRLPVAPNVNHQLKPERRTA